MQAEQHYIVSGNADPVQDVEASAAAIRSAGWWVRAAMPEQWPLTTEAAGDLLQRGGEFDVNGASLQDLIDRRIIDPPGKGEGGALEWDASDILRIVLCLEFRQQWLPTPSRHDAKKHQTQLLLELARQQGELDACADNPPMPVLDLTHLLRMMAATDSREGREKLVSMLKVVLERELEIFLP